MALHALLSRAPRLTLAIAESVTCGRIQAAVGAVSGASAYFLGGVTAYAPEQKSRLLGVRESTLREKQIVSADVAAEMAIGACRSFGSDLAVATTGYAEPAPAAGFPEPGAFWAIARRRVDGEPHIVRQGIFKVPGLARVPVQEAVADEVLGALVEFLRQFRDAEAASKFA